ncbi:hypothetical protein [Candidatus Parabeggiatoa sp. HSG14]|uniref:hypothetical protein n=1 Tax=Candidatus Parabeggiatoa sp. HSG14 TaxID=3055593 RepID=UPI0025A6C51D|nr:hypothetical protein [Thiotrichales bacterium HSG14]
MKRYLLITIVTLLVLAGCTHRPIPVAISYSTTGQQKMQAAHHWNILAGQVSKRVKMTLDVTFPDATAKPSLFIKTREGQERNPFGKAFYSLLTTKLVQQGLVVLNRNDHSNKMLVVEYDMQVVHHKDRRLTYLPPGMFTLLGGGVWMVDQAIEHWTYPGLAAVPFLLAADVDSALDYYLPGETNTEVIITTSMIMGQQYVFGDSRIYYINEGDYDHYEYENLAKTYRVVNQ